MSAERSPSKKHEDFVREKMRGKAADTIAGIGDAGAQQLRAVNFSKASDVLGQFLVLHENDSAFEDWLKENASALDSRRRKEVIQCLKDWILRNL
eukprot:m.18584 g.18584  ORF g.18584 m.18584 type:complete len:95 (-) comp8517_c0_seq1:137-421(-)